MWLGGTDVSQVAVAACPEGIVVASESLVTSGPSRKARGLAQKVFPIGPRLAFAAVGNASMPDPRIDDRWPGLGAHLVTLSGGKPVEGAPVDVASRIAQFVVDVLQYLAERPRGWEGLAIATWHVRYVVAGFAAEGGAGVVSSWTATTAEAFEDSRLTTDGTGKVALGVFDEWPRLERPRRIGSDPSDGPVLDRAEAAARRVVNLAMKHYPSACGGPLQVLRILPEGGCRWVDRPEWIGPIEGD